MIIAHTLYYSYAHSRMASQISMAFYLLRRQRKNHQGTTNLNSVFMYDEGEKQDFNTWLMHLEDYFTRNNITDDRVKIMDAHTAMAGKVQSFFSALRCAAAHSHRSLFIMPWSWSGKSSLVRVCFLKLCRPTCPELLRLVHALTALSWQPRLWVQTLCRPGGSG